MKNLKKLIAERLKADSVTNAENFSGVTEKITTDVLKAESPKNEKMTDDAKVLTARNFLKPIETEYKGYKFRSRLEARWAVFFDACNVSWEYEPEGFDLGNGIYYLPDFLLHNVTLLHHSECNIDLWVEVKGQLTDKDRAKIEKFSKVAFNRGITPNENPILVVSKIPEGEKLIDLRDSALDMAYAREYVEPFNLFTVDGDYYGSILGIRNENIILASENSDDYFCLDEEKNCSRV